jgi:hypothetical protein
MWSGVEGSLRSKPWLKARAWSRLSPFVPTYRASKRRSRFSSYWTPTFHWWT